MATTTYLSAQAANDRTREAIRAHKAKVAEDCEKAMSEIIVAIGRFSDQGKFDLSWEMGRAPTEAAPGSPLGYLTYWDKENDQLSEHMQFIISTLKGLGYHVEGNRTTFFINWGDPVKITRSL